MNLWLPAIICISKISIIKFFYNNLNINLKYPFKMFHWDFLNFVRFILFEWINLKDELVWYIWTKNQIYTLMYKWILTFKPMRSIVTDIDTIYVNLVQLTIINTLFSTNNFA